MAMQTLVFLCGFLVAAASAYYSAGPVVHTKKPIYKPQKPPGCQPPVFKDGSYSPTIPSGICPYGTVLHFQCKHGYRLNGPEHAKCTASGHWSPPHIPICHKVDRCKYQNPCGHNSLCIESKGQLKCLCKKGYYPKGNKCIMKVCSVPVLNEHCQYSPRLQHQWLPGQKIKFVCPPGYDLKGAQYAKCLHGGRWDQASPICKKRVYCKVPSLSHYCSYTPQYQRTWGYGKKIQFHCPKGFKMVGSAYASCTHGGKWDSYPPKCERPKLCDAPRLPDNCGYSPKGQHSWNIGHKIHFHCPVGYNMVGSGYATCIDHGVWDKHPPTCEKPIMCPPPEVSHGCHYNPNFVAWHIGQKVTFYCPAGHKLVGHAYATCSTGGKWDNAPPRCDAPKVCTLPKLSGSVQQSSGYQKSWKVGQKIIFSCPHGYDLKGSSYAVCQHGGHWSNAPPTCVKKTVCYLPSLNDHCGYGPRDKTYWKVGEKILFHCPTGYDLKGNNYAVCQGDGTWSNHSPICHKHIIVVCHLPKLHDHCGYGPYGKHSWKVNEKIAFHCPKGYDLKGSDYAVCQGDGSWSNYPPVCKKHIVVVCHLPKLHDHCGYGPYGKHSWKAHEKIAFHCPKGYDLKGSDYAVCQGDGSWSNYPPVCKKRDVCYTPHMTKYLSINDPYHLKYFEVGHKMQFICPKGYHLKGKSYAICVAGGQWDTPTPLCVRPMCHKPILTPHCGYQPRYQTTWYPGQKVKFYCPHGYQLTGHPYAQCGYDGKWSTPAPLCKKIQVYCKAPPLPHTCHCHLSTHYKQYYAVGEMAKFSCPHGLKLNGFAVAKCMYNGHWSHPTPVCIKPRPFKFGLGFLTNLG